MVGAVTLDTVTGLPVVSAAEPVVAFQSAPAARPKAAPPTALTPSLFSSPLTTSWSATPRTTEKPVSLVAVASGVLVRVWVAPPSPVRVSWAAVMVSPAVMPLPVTTSVPVLAS